MNEICGYCGKCSEEPLNPYGVHDYCLFEPDESDDEDR